MSQGVCEAVLSLEMTRTSATPRQNSKMLDAPRASSDSSGSIDVAVVQTLVSELIAGFSAQTPSPSFAALA